MSDSLNSILAMPLAWALARAVASAGADESTASTDSHLGARWRAKPPVEVKQSSARPPGITRGGEVIVALIEEDAGLLAVQEVRAQSEAVHPDGDGIRNFACHYGCFERQLFLGADCDIVARDDAPGVENLFQTGCDFGFCRVHALVQSLHHEVVGVAIDDQRRQQIGFAVYHAVGCGIANLAIAKHGASVLFGGAQAAQEEITADLFDLPRKHAQGNREAEL
jgi:hypothetical protein